MENINVGSKLAELRNSLSLTQDEVATSLGISNKTLSKWENGMSEPSLTMLSKLAEYYSVSTDYILGINSAKDIKSTDLLRQELSELDFEGGILKTFQINFEMLRTKIMESISAPTDKKTIVPSSDILDGHYFCRSQVETNEEFEMHLNTDDLSMYIQLLGNRNNFDWLGKEDIQNKIAKLFSFLSKPNALKVMKLIHTKTTSANISVSFVAKRTGLTDEIATEILDEACSIGLCTKNVAHIKDKEITIYMSNGSGKILSLVCIAYEYMCGDRLNDYMVGAQNCRLIDGGKI